MKRSLRFLTLMLTLALILSCGLQIFAEEIERLPSEPIFSTTPCSHNNFSSFPQNYSRSEDPTETDFNCFERPECLVKVWVSYDTNTCVVCSHTWYSNRNAERYIFAHTKPTANHTCARCGSKL